MDESSQQRTGSTRLRRYLKVVLVLAIIAAMNFGGAWLANQVNFHLFPRHDSILNAIVLGSAMLYIVFMAIPFMPGIEIGLALMLLLGSKGALLVYLCTLAALSISFMVGKLIPPRLIYRFLDWLHLYKACALVGQLEPLNQQERLRLLNNKMPARFATLFLKYRFLAIAVLLNLPGNALIGGGGGIGLIVGMSKVVPFHAYVAVIVIAVAPVPLWFFLYGA